MKFTLQDQFWNKYTNLVKGEMLPFQWNVLHDNENIVIDKERDDEGIPSEKSHAIRNFKIAAGLEEGQHYGWLFQDSDVYKWLEAAANSYATSPDRKLKEMMDEIIELIEKTQEEDGYISTYYQIEAPELKFRRLFESHELYCFGHLIQAAIAHYKATDSTRLLQVSEKLVDCIEENFGPEEGKINGADGHQEIELALVELYELTGEIRYLKLSEYFLKVRGQDPNFYTRQLEENISLGIDEGPFPKINTKYHQAHKPVIEQTEAVGHAVRLVYMAASMAEIAYYTENKELFKTCKKLWENIVTKKMYITGGIGSTVHGEAFTYDYDLPNDTMYCETCASIGMMMFARSMLKHEVDASYIDIMERCLYNSVISGMALDGRHFFYVNPLESDPISSKYDPGKSHVKNTRSSWFGCACCPPNIARTLTSLENYAYSLKEDMILVNLFIGSSLEFMKDKGTVSIEQKSDVPYSGEITFNLKLTDFEKITMGIRIPGWAQKVHIQDHNGNINFENINNYAYFEVSEGETQITINFDISIVKWTAHPKVKSNKGKVAIQRGPVVYCLEEHDHSKNLHLISLTDEEITEKRMDDKKLGDIITLETRGEKEIVSDDWNGRLYKKTSRKDIEETKLTFIPYYAWANRSDGEMTVWVSQKERMNEF